MKTRIITGLTGAAGAILALVRLDSPLLGILLIPFAAMACHEICSVAKVKNKAMLWFGTAVAALVPPWVEYRDRLPAFLQIPSLALVAFCFAALCLLALLHSDETRFEHVLFTLFASIAVPAALASLLAVRDLLRRSEGGAFRINLAVYFLFFIFCCAWLTDTFAYFVGGKLGKHKLSPKISPKKTVEGAIGGVLCTLLANIGFALLFNAVFLKGEYHLNVPALVLLSLPLCLISMLGDLTFSLIKRNFGEKDFGKFFPGHGGAMDRFDSLVFVAPCCALLLQMNSQLQWDLFYTRILA
ncbi:MAG: phosphatidate cytidylyltransferase [Oscillospiraceae bacterium]|jgi:phosphatidate cytidylyltransferase|nr:phosphatidate cytidylyltransferase [Oscillospiraceae bacterium]